MEREGLQRTYLSVKICIATVSSLSVFSCYPWPCLPNHKTSSLKLRKKPLFSFSWSYSALMKWSIVCLFSPQRSLKGSLGSRGRHWFFWFCLEIVAEIFNPGIVIQWIADRSISAVMLQADMSSYSSWCSRSTVIFCVLEFPLHHSK